ncbi:MAG: Asp-tRNA(Asn)/Glu-tRNA(Gln) amidotransferase subunit GatC [Gammaproteobacteria bacterium]|jgi:aspartyl-tRNA(Asn)/glutamyl-tRNA(Gln) amidotransferase subunit C|nr:Asp-tRNA(Asn)/Glu-tRNA(Gln) amidotransferase subunit GatC [Gammaproteobacteria bacterium]
MALELKDVAKIAHLARLQVTDAEIPAVTQRLSTILELIEQLQAAPTDGIEPMAHPTDAVQRLRPDVVTETDRRNDYQRIAPAVEDGLYLVPKVIE